MTPMLLNALSQNGAAIPNGSDEDAAERRTDGTADIDAHTVRRNGRRADPISVPAAAPPPARRAP